MPVSDWNGEVNQSQGLASPAESYSSKQRERGPVTAAIDQKSCSPAGLRDVWLQNERSGWWIENRNERDSFGMEDLKVQDALFISDSASQYGNNESRLERRRALKGNQIVIAPCSQVCTRPRQWPRKALT